MQAVIAKLPQFSNELTLCSFWSGTYDVIGWTDEGDDSVLKIVATFEAEKDANEYATKDGACLLVRPPSTHVHSALRWISALERFGSSEGIELRR